MFAKQLIIILTAFSLFCIPLQVYASSSIVIDANEQLEFAEHYFLIGEYVRAVDEYKRFIYFFPEDSRVEETMYKIGMAYFSDQNFKEAIKAFEQILDKYQDSAISLKSYFMISECQLRQHEFGPAITNLHNLITISDDPKIIDEAHYRLGWIYVETASWEEARSYFENIQEQKKETYRLSEVYDALGKTNSIPRKNPATAGILSIIPGAGYLYCERYQDALIAFLLNGGLILAAYESFDNDLNALGAVITFVEIGFYAGNIYGAVSSAHKYNRTNTQNFIDNIKENLKIQIAARPVHDLRNTGITISFDYRF
ncbi:tetratricopeptide repeat protein [Thermodesulfobacteriota bacterium]